MTKSIYLAAPFFSDLQINRVKQVKELLQSNPTVNSENIFVPMEHPMKDTEMETFPWQVGTFEHDVHQIHSSDVVVAILDYQKDGDETLSDSGTVFEIGMAFEHGTPVVLVQFEETHLVNLVLARSYTAFFNNEEVTELSKYDFNNLPSIFKDFDVI